MRRSDTAAFVERPAMPDFKFFLIHKSGYRVLGAGHRQDDCYIMFRVHHPSAQVYDATGRPKRFKRVGGLEGDEIQTMIESGEWEIAGSNPYT